MNDVDLASNVDNNTLFFVGRDIDEVISKLQNALKTLLELSYDSQRNANWGMCYFICSFKEHYVKVQRINNSPFEHIL